MCLQMISLPDTSNIQTLGQIYCNATGLSEARVADLACSNPYLFKRLRENKGCTVKTYNRVLQWFSDHWPADDLLWPADIERPEPGPDSPAAKSVQEGSLYRNEGAGASVSELLKYRRALLDKEDYDKAAAVQEAAIVVASVLGADGLIACPNDLCAALDVPRHAYDQVIRSYADGKPRQRRSPRSRRFGPSDSERILCALTDVGDVRFAKRRERDQAVFARVGAVL